MKINCEGRSIDVYCEGGCYCHHMNMTYGEKEGCCVECGCPKDRQAFDKLWSQQERIKNLRCEGEI